jgi:small subunit ribosomal protein S25e
MGNKNKSVSSNEKSQKPKEGKGKKDKKNPNEKKEIAVFINEQEAAKIVRSAKVITVQELAKQTGVKISTANVFLKKSLSDGLIKKVGGFSGHYVYQPLSQ